MFSQADAAPDLGLGEHLDVGADSEVHRGHRLLLRRVVRAELRDAELPAGQLRLRLDGHMARGRHRVRQLGHLIPWHRRHGVRGQIRARAAFALAVGSAAGRGSRVDAWVRQAPGRRHCADSSVWVSVMRSTVCVFGYCFPKWKKVHLSMIKKKKKNDLLFSITILILRS